MLNEVNSNHLFKMINVAAIYGSLSDGTIPQGYAHNEITDIVSHPTLFYFILSTHFTRWLYEQFVQDPFKEHISM